MAPKSLQDGSAETSFVESFGLNPANVFRFVRKADGVIEFHLLLDEAPPELAELRVLYPTAEITVAVSVQGRL
jgi:hypothetical protein